MEQFFGSRPGHEPGTSSTQRYISFDCDTLLPDPFQFNFEGTLSPELEKFNHLKKNNIARYKKNLTTFLFLLLLRY